MKRLNRVFGKVRASVQDDPPAEYLAEALSELERSQADKLTWATALNEANGDAEYAKTIYMRQRGRILADLHRQAAEAEQRAAHKRQLLHNYLKRNPYIRVTCGHCHTQKRVKSTLYGKALTCSKCGGQYIVHMKVID